MKNNIFLFLVIFFLFNNTCFAEVCSEEGLMGTSKCDSFCCICKYLTITDIIIIILIISVIFTSIAFLFTIIRKKMKNKINIEETAKSTQQGD